MKKTLNTLMQALVFTILLPWMAHAQTEQCFPGEEQFSDPFTFGSPNELIRYTSETGFTLSPGFEASATSQQELSISWTATCPQEGSCFAIKQIFSSPITFGSTDETIVYNGEEGFSLREGFKVSALNQERFALRWVEQCDNLPSGVPDLQMNWTLSQSYDENGQMIGASKTFFDQAGKPLQSQVLFRSENNVLATQSLDDALGRPVLTTLPAPIQRSGFAYKANFVADALGNPYTFTHFDEGNKRYNPDPLGDDQSGTLGWYYSDNNSEEAYVPASAYPYSRIELYDDGSGEIKKSAGPGEAFRLGAGHEMYSSGFPLLEELDGHYLQIRNTHIFPNNTISSLSGKGVKRVDVDANGKAQVSFFDEEGRLLASAIPDGTVSTQSLSVDQQVPLPTLYYSNLSGAAIDILDDGTATPADSIKIRVHESAPIQIYDRMGSNVLLFEGVAHGRELKLPITLDGSQNFDLQIRSLGNFNYEVLKITGWGTLGTVLATDEASQEGREFYIPGGSIDVTLTNNTDMSSVPVQIKNRQSESTVYNQDLTGTAPLSLSEGFYSLHFFDQAHDLSNYPISDDYTGHVTISYSYSLSHWTYNYYDLAGRLVAEVSPNGVKQLLDGEAYADIDKNTYEYNYQGWLLAQEEKDHGRTEYMYRKDGSIRFSQNAEQAITGRYSYVNYNRTGRPVEAGEFDPLQTSLTFGSAALKAILEDKSADGGLVGGSRTDWVKTFYDLPDPNFATETGLSNYNQRFVYGDVSYTENEESKTWYSYGEQGEVVWTVQHVKELNRSYTIDYTYDFHGNITETVYQKDDVDERFYHHYTYDADQRLSQVHTSGDGANQELQATYKYYLHGPLKRVELADRLQGIDYVYTLQGWLKSINHPDENRDPGNDGGSFAPDVFGMALEYFSGDYIRSGTTIATVNPSGVDEQYSGNVRAVSWRTQKPDIAGGSNTPVAYAFSYDHLYQLQEAQWGTPDFNTGVFTPATNTYRVNGLNYDANGNIKTLARRDQNGNMLHDFSYSYVSNSNRLDNVSSYANYGYNAIGKLIHEDLVSGTDKYLEYNASGKLSTIYSDAAHTDPQISYTYNDQGFRLRKKDHSNNKETWYIRNANGSLISLYDNDNVGSTLEQKEVTIYGMDKLGTQYIADASTLYELKDYLGTVRATINRNKKGDGTADVAYYADYYPYGLELASAGTPYRYGYQGDFAEKDPETGWNAFELRMYDPTIGRWLSPDPYRQHWSPYLAMGNNPISLVDPDGGEDMPTVYYEMQVNQYGQELYFGDPLSDFLSELEQGVGVGQPGFAESLIPVWGSARAAVDDFQNGRWAWGTFNAVMAATDVFLVKALAVGAGKLIAKGTAKLAARQVAKQAGKQTGCFTEGTKVLTNEGLKNIEDIVAGDMVWAYNDSTGTPSLKEAYDPIIRQVDHLQMLRIDGDTLYTTDEHPFYVSGKWVKAAELRAGDSLTLYKGGIKLLEANYKLDTAVTVYNFAVEDYHNYYVTEFGILVHNTEKCLRNLVKFKGETVPVYRGGDSFQLKPNEFKINKATGNVKTTHGVSLDVDPNTVSKFGGAFKIESLPEGLKIIQRGRRAEHFEIVPEVEMTVEKFQSLLDMIKISPVN